MSALDDMLNRLTLLQQDVFPGSDAVPVVFYAQEATPYWTNDFSSFDVQLDSEQIQIVTYHGVMQLVLGAITQGFEQEAERLTYIWIPAVTIYFGQRRQLKRTSADAPVPFLYPSGAVITGGSKRNDIANSGIGQLMFGIDFNIDVPMWQETDQVVF